ncbi:protein-methionine-sulfoxide reductase heme-binding subunit MsrQ [Falsiroseomonas tokyonensis]|uniref:Protein-methionine-sulfoxide reductase heme-binding subunit MsrQ n=1 Tax=Falsiroseomonas tokyonensis TaxID=430521 RepID=A0ABV7BT87_9PROT|nr:ferric reductase-like transmembrane domain-containing protein [Falsiroseomonas tokyonensis]MBU8537884.1 ferric reductase-like transmembrane domain-containing protein [Falsiroseomonas tokyonensis]
MSSTTLPGPIAWPWRDRAGRFSWLRACVLAAALSPGLVLLALLAAGEMGAEPWKAATREAGTHAMRLLLVSLAVTPLRYLADWPKVVTLRRMLGLVALGYALLHLLLYTGHMAWNLADVASEIVLRFYLTLGFAVLLGLSVLGWTSTDGWQRRLGRRWKRLHKGVYVLAGLGIFHAFLQAKSRADSAVVLAGIFLWLMGWRLLPGWARAHGGALAGLAVLAALGAAGLEWGWYAATTNLPAARILAANLDPGAGLRPAQGVLAAGLAVAALTALRRRFA